MAHSRRFSFQNFHKYRTRWIAFAIWLLLLCLLPPVMEALSWVPPGTGFVPRILIFFCLPAIFLSRISFRIGTAIVLTGALFSLFTPVSLRIVMDGLNYRMQDVFFHLRGPRKPSGQVVIVDIDESSLRQIGQWPWPRTEVARLVDSIKADGARCIGMDILFAEPDRHSLGHWLQRMKDLGIQDEGEELQIDAEQVRKIVVREWKERLSAKDPTYKPDPGLSESELQASVVSEYIEEKQGAWEETQQTIKDRFQHAGLAYTPKLFVPPKDPFADMVRFSKELFYLRHAEEKGYLAIRDNDRALGEAMHSGNVVGGGMFITPQNAGKRVGYFHKQEARRETAGMVVSAGIVGAEQTFPGMRQAVEQVINIPKIQEQLFHQGSFNIVPDASGAARFYTMLMQAPVFQESLVLKDGREGLSGGALLDPDNYESKIVSQFFTYPGLALEMLRVANGYDKLSPGYLDGERGLFLRREDGFPYGLEYTAEAFSGLLPKQRFLPVDFKGDIAIDFIGYGGAWQPESFWDPDYYFEYVSASDILHGRVDPDTFRGKYVLIGSTDPTLSDLVGSPFRPAFPGLEVHAVVLDNLIQERYLLDHGKWSTLYQFLGILIVGIIAAGVIAYVESWVAGLATVMILGGLPAVSYVGLAHGGVVINFVYPWLVGFLMTGAVVVTNFFVEGRDRRFVVTQFSKMVSGDVLKKLRDDPSGVSLKGQRTPVTVSFSDIAGFTTISESMDPQDLVKVLNDYFTPMTNIILGHDGFIDKFIGDAIMSCWGVPFSDTSHAKKACLAALDQQAALKELAPRIREEYGIEISVRMGIASGDASAALMGSEYRKSYTVMGDVVNLGARLEPICKDYNVPILIDQNTYDQAKDAVEARCVDRIIVKGQSVPIAIYELISRKGMAPATQKDLTLAYERALHLHWERKWDESLEILNELSVRYPGDGPTENLKARIEGYQIDSPPENWSGEFIKMTK